MINLGTQYYRAPFPAQRYWADDLSRMVDAGLNTVQLWVLWAWVEPTPGTFRFEDYDTLIELAEKKGLGIVLSTIAEIHPYWIHREVPDSEMITNMGHKVVSSNRVECHFGLTPGGCFDHPEVWSRMKQFLETVVSRYRSVSALRGWDAWNELRWNVNADGAVCYCPQTLARFRGWLDAKYKGLDGLNAAWQRRYSCWEDVLPGKMPRGPYTEMMAFQDFICWRSCQHGRDRYDAIKACDNQHPITVHGGNPSVNSSGDYPLAMAQDRGNDWSYADHLDGVGCSSFPAWGRGQDLADFTIRINAPAAAARGKEIWLSELQGGRASTAFSAQRAVQAAEQQRWLWTGISKKASTILFWCWRDEVFGRESGGFGIIGRDGQADARLQALHRTGKLIKEHQTWIDAYQPDTARVGVFYSPQTYFLHWAEAGEAFAASNALRGYSRALTRRNIPTTYIEENHLEELAGIKLLFMPRTLVIDDSTAQQLTAFIRDGGTLVCESECGAFDSTGLYRDPAERFLAKLTGFQEVGRRPLTGNSVTVTIDSTSMTVPASQWITPYVGREESCANILASSPDGPLLLRVPVGKGYVVLYGGYSGQGYYQGSFLKEEGFTANCEGFEHYVAALAKLSGIAPCVQFAASDATPPPFVQVTTGRSGERRVAFLFSEETSATTVRFPPGFFQGPVSDILQGRQIPTKETVEYQEFVVADMQWGMAILAD